MDLSMKNFHILGVKWNIEFLGGSQKNNIEGGIA